MNYPEMTAATVQGDNLVASFWDPGSHQSSICSFALSRIQLTFWYNIDRCRGGADSVGLPHIGRDKKCFNVSDSVSPGDYLPPRLVSHEMFLALEIADAAARRHV